MKPHIKYVYLCDTAIACIASNIDLEKKELSYQVSICNPVDVFDKPIARQLAIGRLVEKPIKFTFNGELNAFAISKLILNHILSSQQKRIYPRRFYKAVIDALWGLISSEQQK
jgi:hypothetical protein